MFARMDREQQEAIAEGRACPKCHSPNKAARWFYRDSDGPQLTRCENYEFHFRPRRRKLPMPRQDWYMAYMLSILAGACFFDGSRVSGGICLAISVLLVVIEYGFGVRL